MQSVPLNIRSPSQSSQIKLSSRLHASQYGIEQLGLPSPRTYVSLKSEPNPSQLIIETSMAMIKTVVNELELLIIIGN